MGKGLGIMLTKEHLKEPGTFILKIKNRENTIAVFQNLKAAIYKGADL